VKPRLFKTLAGATAFLASRPRRALHLIIEHDPNARCTPSRCVCRPLYRVAELTADGWIETEEEQRQG
jgi:hypothetical protein